MIWMLTKPLTMMQTKAYQRAMVLTTTLLLIFLPIIKPVTFAGLIRIQTTGMIWIWTVGKIVPMKMSGKCALGLLRVCSLFYDFFSPLALLSQHVASGYYLILASE